MKTLMGFKDSLRTTLLGVCALAALGAGSAQGAPLNLSLLPFPDIEASFITVNYDPGTDVLTANGFALVLDDDGSPPTVDITGGTFALTASIDGSGALLSSSTNTLTIGGTVPGASSGTLLTGNLTAFGWQNDVLEFVFGVTGGELSSLYGPLGGVILTVPGFDGYDFAGTSSFVGSGDASADIGVVPLPAAFWLFGSAMLGIFGFMRRGRAERD